ncbi:MAG: hypothetical protein ABI151_12015 [Chitinophagaceae bacterium]
MTGNLVGIADKDPYEDFLKEGGELGESFDYSALEALRKSFATIFPIVYQKLVTVKDEQLDKAFHLA